MQILSMCTFLSKSEQNNRHWRQAYILPRQHNNSYLPKHVFSDVIHQGCKTPGSQVSDDCILCHGTYFFCKSSGRNSNHVTHMVHRILRHSRVFERKISVVPKTYSKGKVKLTVLRLEGTRGTGVTPPRLLVLSTKWRLWAEFTRRSSEPWEKEIRY